MSLTLLTPPVAEPVSVSDLKTHLRVTSSAEDAMIAGLGLAARQAIEARYGLCILAQEWRLSLDRVPDHAITLPFSPILSVEHVGVTRQGITEVILPSDYDVHVGLVGRLRMNRAVRTDARLAAVKITFIAGWTTPESVPEEIRLAIKVLAAHFFENREGGVADRFYTSPEGLHALLAPYRQVRV